MGEWVRSSYCAASECIEVGFRPNRVDIRIRDKDAGGLVIIDVSPQDWAAFIEGVKNGEFDVPQL